MIVRSTLLFLFSLAVTVCGFVPTARGRHSGGWGRVLFSSTTTDAGDVVDTPAIDYEEPEDPVIRIKQNAMNRLRELREKQPDGEVVLRMGVRNGGCSGLSYVMDFSTEDAIEEDDAIDDYPAEKIKCVVDAKSMLYLYGLELDYSDELIGGGFKFFNPNAEEACGCGSSFGV
mmetsp:Transcript_4716/g.6552  ORF Transcript_4716/g.6552 Transcript_4716/m.6552 type:complete len:173 (-) Transcript_4716:154-672(-)|eukprot:CAMPEP_0194047260 /NCGR_PEP_ID=MMETSP0009_2-20130614/23703_1 /TAXON_ID=210454 /ORGANISM="Grammatophora oceanica, Strain CCMP 410" /LENGTH=172 /DNA_ID=CAMNT_0038692817 /DNA_START=59 /DNA_END=577 /DNA_ORIENTATION=+